MIDSSKDPSQILEPGISEGTVGSECCVLKGPCSSSSSSKVFSAETSKDIKIVSNFLWTTKVALVCDEDS